MILKKELGQNFLKDDYTIEKLIEATHLKPTDVVLEIGPGQGSVTEQLIKKTAKVISVEIDRDLIPALDKKFYMNEKLQLVNEDALKFMQKLIDDEGIFENKKINKLVSSLPYQITSPLLHKLAFTINFIGRTSLIIQKEVAERLTQKAPDSNYLATFLQTFFEIEIIEVVEKELFDPIPQVDGAIISVKPKKIQIISTEEILKFSKFLHHGFLQPRKMLNKRFDREFLGKCGIEPSRRAETLTGNEWLNLYKAHSNWQRTN